MKIYRKKIVLIFACFVAAGFFLIIYPEMSADAAITAHPENSSAEATGPKEYGMVSHKHNAGVTDPGYAIAMFRLNQQIILTHKEREQLATIVGESCNPQTVEEYNAWLDYACRDCDPNNPDLRILAAVLQEMKLPELQPL